MLSATKQSQTQIQASELAEVFNEKVKGFSGHCTLEFIKPSLISCEGENGEQSVFLTEVNLDPKGDAWQKWNANDGGFVLGRLGSGDRCITTDDSENSEKFWGKFSALEQEEDLEGAVNSDFLQGERPSKRRR